MLQDIWAMFQIGVLELILIKQIKIWEEGIVEPFITKLNKYQ